MNETVVVGGEVFLRSRRKMSRNAMRMEKADKSSHTLAHANI